MIRPAGPDDAEQILCFIHELAEYERLSDRLATDVGALRRHLAGPNPLCEALLAVAAQPVGFALYFTSYSTFETSPCLHLEDLFVRPAARGLGHGKALLQAVAARARARGCARVEWAVLDWNQPAIDFYERLGARVLSDWRICRVEREGIARLAGEGQTRCEQP